MLIVLLKMFLLKTLKLNVFKHIIIAHKFNKIQFNLETALHHRAYYICDPNRSFTSEI